MGTRDDVSLHDCTTLGGNSGSVVLDVKTGEAVGLHFAGLYRESNRAVRASVVSDYINRKRWTRSPVAEAPKSTRPVPPVARPTAQSGRASEPLAPVGAVTVTIPLSITVSLGQPVVPAALANVSSTVAAKETMDIEAAVKISGISFQTG
jgi:hypothetical protein